MRFINIILAEIAAIKQNRKNLREFGIIFCIVGIVLAAISFYKNGFLTSASLILFAAALAFLASGLFTPNILKPFHKVWMSLAVIMGYILSHVVLLIAFFLVITPMGLLLRLIRKDILDLKLNKSDATFWKDYENVPDKGRYRKMF